MNAMATSLQGNERIELIGESAPMQEVRRFIELMAQAGGGPDPPTVLITGETGTGKGVIARAMRAQSARAGAPFIAVLEFATP